MTASTTVPQIQFHDGRSIPQLGYGVWQVADDVADDVVQHALEIGYRHVDTAKIYGNERGVGRAIAASDVERGDVFVTTKLWNSDQGDPDVVRAALEASLARLDMEFVDLYLIHWAAPAKDRFVDSWRGLVQAQGDGLVRSIGVSNFHEPHLERVIDATDVVPVINQVELHPYLQQRELRATHERLGIVTQAWSPLGQGGELLADPVIVGIAEEISDVTPAQVVLRWHLQRGIVTIPKSSTPSRIAENFDVFGFELSGDQLAAIDALDRGAAGRIGPDPDTANFE